MVYPAIFFGFQHVSTIDGAGFRNHPQYKIQDATCSAKAMAQWLEWSWQWTSSQLVSWLGKIRGKPCEKVWETIETIWRFPEMGLLYPQIIYFTIFGFSIINHPFWGTLCLETFIWKNWGNIWVNDLDSITWFAEPDDCLFSHGAIRGLRNLYCRKYLEDRPT